MTYTIKITDQADNDIRNIYEYIAYELQSPENASGQLDRIEKCIMSLDDRRCVPDHMHNTALLFCRWKCCSNGLFYS